VNNAVHDIALREDGKILIGGRFTEVGGQQHHRIALLHADGSIDPTLLSRINDSVHGVTVQADGNILIIGDFTQVDGQMRKYIARLLHPDR
jgi:hypothetical protein